MAALAEASVAILWLMGKRGQHLLMKRAEWLRQQPVPVLLAVNKCESPEQGAVQAAQFWDGIG